MRVTGGRLRGRRLEVPAGASLRPSSDRLRQTLFNILAHGRYAGILDGARVLDGFAGTGALGIEALSRGAGHATFIDSQRAVAAALARVLRNFDLDEVASVVVADMAAPPRALASRAATLILLDPPYGEGLGVAAIAALDRAGWIAPDALVVLEVGAREPVELPAGFTLAERRAIGDSALLFLRRADMQASGT